MTLSTGIGRGYHGLRAPSLAGRSFGWLLVLERVDRRPGRRSVEWRCECMCGRTKVVRGERLASGRVQSCGRWCVSKRS